MSNTDPDGYVIDATAYRNLRAVMTRLYEAGHKRLTGDDIRDLANTMDANLSRAEPIMADSDRWHIRVTENQSSHDPYVYEADIPATDEADAREKAVVYAMEEWDWTDANGDPIDGTDRTEFVVVQECYRVASNASR